MRSVLTLLAILFLSSCAQPLRSSVAPFRPPETLPNARQVGTLVIAADPIDTPQKSTRIFGTDLAAAGILPVHLIVSNKGTQEYEIDAAQIFGVAGGEYFPAYNLDQASRRVRESSIGTTVATQAALGAIALGAAGAAVGAGIGHAAGNAGAGAGAGAAVGATSGALGGAAAGSSDSYTNRFRHELAVQDFGAKNIYGGDLYRGFIYFQAQPYTAIRVKVTNISERKSEVIEIPLQVAR
jgi:outer membrane lipoprotein SlyB